LTDRRGFGAAEKVRVHWKPIGIRSTNGQVQHPAGEEDVPGEALQLLQDNGICITQTLVE
jgi:hypothetical protein